MLSGLSGFQLLSVQESVHHERSSAPKKMVEYIVSPLKKKKEKGIIITEQNRTERNTSETLFIDSDSTHSLLSKMQILCIIHVCIYVCVYPYTVCIYVYIYLYVWRKRRLHADSISDCSLPLYKGWYAFGVRDL